MKRFLVVLSLVGMLVGTSSAQDGPWSHFWHPRPPIVKSDMAIFGSTVSVGEWMFKPTFSIIATSFTPVSGQPWQTGIFNGAGPALTYQYSTQDVNGVNYAEYSASLGIYFAGATNADPHFQPAAALMLGALNNILNIGAGVKFSGDNKFFLLASFNVNLTQN